MILGIPENQYWEEYLGWQPNVYAVEKVLDHLSKENIPVDFLFTKEDLSNFEFEILTHCKRINGLEGNNNLEVMIQEIKNNSILILNDSESIIDLLDPKRLMEKDLEFICSQARYLRIKKDLKKFLPKGWVLEFNREDIKFEGALEEISKGQYKVLEEGVFEFFPKQASWLGIQLGSNR